MHFEFELTREEYQQACSGIATIPSSAASHRTSLRWAGTITAAIGLLAFMKRESLADWLAPSLLTITGLAILIVPIWRAFASVEEAWQQRPSRMRKVSIDADEAGMRVAAHGWRSELEWEIIEGFLETRDLFLLFSDAQRNNLLLVLPKHAIGDAAQVTTFRSFLNRNDRRLRGAFPVVPPRDDPK
jgi:hypothetical protein